jgi:hypothetical protein
MMPVPPVFDILYQFPNGQDNNHRDNGNAAVWQERNRHFVGPLSIRREFARFGKSHHGV